MNAALLCRGTFIDEVFICSLFRVGDSQTGSLNWGLLSNWGNGYDLHITCISN